MPLNVDPTLHPLESGVSTYPPLYYGVVGGLVRHALENGIGLSDIPASELGGFSDLLDEEYYEVLGEGSWLDSKVSRGGTSSVAVAIQLELARESLSSIGG